MRIFTIGVYASTELLFFKKLAENKIDTFCDIRQRRGVRGHEYAFVNSTYLQQKLKVTGIQYTHILSLAPTTEIREKQKIEDTKLREHKRDRNKLGKFFSDEYKKNIICKFDFDSFVEQLKNMGAENVVFLCVEEKANACHRSIVAEEMKRRYNYEVTHL